MRIILLAQWFDPEPTFKGLLFARELAKRGHLVQVITGFPNYPTGKLYSGYRLRLWQNEVVDGVRVLRVPLYPSHDRSALKRVANYVSFACAAAVACFIVPAADVAYVYHPPATIGLPAIVLKWFRRIPVVLDVQDLWPDTLRATGMLHNQTVLKATEWWCRAIYKLSTRIAVLSPGFKAMLVSRRVGAEKIDVIYNWCDEQAINHQAATLLPGESEALSGRFNVIFAGNMGPAQGLDAVLDAAAMLQPTHSAVQFVFVGTGIDTERLRASAASRNIRNVLFLPRRAPTQMDAILSRADGLLVHLRDEDLFRITIPSKTQAYLRSGRPIIMAVRGDAANLVQSAGAGLLCEPENPAEIARTVIELFEMSPSKRLQLGTNGAAFYRRNLSLGTGVSCFEASFAAAAADRFR